MSLKRSKTKTMAMVAIFGALSAVVMMVFEFPIPFLPPFYKVDFSDVVVLIVGLLFGVLPAIATEGIKVLLFLIIRGSSTSGVGELAAFLSGLAFVIPVILIYRKKKSTKSLFIGLGAGIVTLGIVATILNYVLLIPVYVAFNGWKLEDITQGYSLLTFVLVMTLPFNLIKGILLSIVTGLLHKRIIKPYEE